MASLIFDPFAHSQSGSAFGYLRRRQSSLTPSRVGLPAVSN